MGAQGRNDLMMFSEDEQSSEDVPQGMSQIRENRARHYHQFENVQGPA